jgi:hypothetical protein
MGAPDLKILMIILSDLSRKRRALYTDLCDRLAKLARPGLLCKAPGL